MFKKVLVALSAAIIILSMSGCNVKDNVSSSDKSTQITAAGTRVHNNFKDALPDFNFKSEISESYEESINYSFNVKCSEGECKRYIKSLKKAGFTESAVETETYYTAFTEDGYFVEMTYIEGNLTVYSKKVK